MPNRIAVYLTALAALAGGLAPVVGNLDLTSTIGIAAGLATIATVVHKWLEGWQHYESRTALADLGVPGESDRPRNPDA